MKTPNMLFVYGTLSFPEVISKLLGRNVALKPATLSGYKRVRVKGKAYPALVAGKGSVEGVLMQNLSKDEMTLLDTFEDDFYDRLSVKVTKEGKEVNATVYVVLPRNLRFVTGEIWDRERFARDYLDSYIKMASKYRQDYLAGASGPQEF